MNRYCTVRKRTTAHSRDNIGILTESTPRNQAEALHQIRWQLYKPSTAYCGPGLISPRNLEIGSRV